MLDIRESSPCFYMRGTTCVEILTAYVHIPTGAIYHVSSSNVEKQAGEHD
jgi:hypothetical protein